jgi:hypothetical protein
VKGRFIDVGQHYSLYTDEEGQRRIYIPATIEDNPMLMQADPDYVRQLNALKEIDPDLWKAWRLGDWSIIAGQSFREWDARFHVNDTFEFRLADCKKFVCFDWGYNSPGCALWCAITPENKYGIVRIYVYRELYLTRYDPRMWANQFKVIQKLDSVRDIWLPHDCFNKEMGESIADIFHREGNMNVLRANTMQRETRHMRKALFHSVLADADDGRPIIQIHSNCHNLIRTIPELINDDNDPEDIDTDGEDHAYDALTYGLMMEIPHFRKSGGLKHSQVPEIIPGVFHVLPDESLLPPNLMDAVAHANTRTSSRPRPT